MQSGNKAVSKLIEIDMPSELREILALAIEENLHLVKSQSMRGMYRFQIKKSEISSKFSDEDVLVNNLLRENNPTWDDCLKPNILAVSLSSISTSPITAWFSKASNEDKTQFIEVSRDAMRCDAMWCDVALVRCAFRLNVSRHFCPTRRSCSRMTKAT